MTQSNIVRPVDDLSTIFSASFDDHDDIQEGNRHEWVTRFFEEHPANATDQADMGVQPEDVSPAVVNGRRVLGRMIRYIIAGGAMALRRDDLKDVKAAIYDLDIAGENGRLLDALRLIAQQIEGLLAERDVMLEAVTEAELEAGLERLEAPPRLPPI